MEGLPRNITNQAYMRELHFPGADGLREIPVNIGQLSKLQEMSIGSQLLESLPTSIGDLSSLTRLEIYQCPKLGCLPESLGCLNHLKQLKMRNSGARSLSIVVRKASISKDCCPGLESLELVGNDCLTEIDVQSTILKRMELQECKMLRKIRGIDGLLNIQKLIISGCPELEFLPSFAQLACLKRFELRRCYGVKRVDGLEHCTAMKVLIAHTRWEEAGIQSLERMGRLSHVSLKANSKAGVEGCIQRIRNLQRRPETVGILLRAVPDAATLLNCFDFSDLSIVGSIANHKMIPQDIFLGESLKRSYSARCILECLVLNYESPEALLSLSGGDSLFRFDSVQLEEGKWVFITVITQHSRLFNNNNHDPHQIALELEYARRDSEVGLERGLWVTGEEERVMEAFAHLCALLSD